MQNQPSESAYIDARPKYLWLLLLTFAMVIVTANWFDARLVVIWGHTLSPGTLIFPLTYLVADMITEVYGYKNARRAIWVAFIFNIIFLAYGQFLTYLPSPSFAATNIAFDELLKVNFTIVLASFISYIISETTNSYIVAKTKVKFAGQFLGLRFVMSMIIASGLDSIIFATIAYFGDMSFSALISMASLIWFTKLIIAAIGLPISVRLAKKLKQIEQSDIYDTDTNFNILSLDATYSSNDNYFGKVISGKF